MSRAAVKGETDRTTTGPASLIALFAHEFAKQLSAQLSADLMARLADLPAAEQKSTGQTVDDPFMDTAETSVFVNAAPRSIDRWVAAGTFPAPIRMGRKRLWRRSTVEAYMNQRQASAA